MKITASRFIYVPEFVHDGVIEKEAFLPPARPRPFETSVIIHDENGPEWNVGKKIGALRTHPVSLVGSAEFTSEMASVANLNVEPHPTAISRNHANLKGWDEVDKLQRLVQAEAIASLSEFCIIPPNCERLEIDEERRLAR